MTEYEPNVRRALDSWQFWIGVAYFGLAACVVALFVLFGRQADQDAARRAAEASTNTAKVLDCLQTVSRAPTTLALIDALELTVRNQIETTRDSLLVAPNGELATIRRQELERLDAALDKVTAFRRLFTSATPTKAGCERMARDLRVRVPTISGG